MKITKSLEEYYCLFDLKTEESESVSIKVNKEFENHIMVEYQECWRDIDSQIDYFENIIKILQKLKEEL